MAALVWETKLDKRYDVFVERSSDYTGVLIIKDGDKELLREKVGLSYGAKFGPDVDDVNQWKERAIGVVDKVSQ